MKLSNVDPSKEILSPPVATAYQPPAVAEDKEQQMEDEAATRAARDAGYVTVKGRKLHALGDLGSFMQQQGVVNIGRGMLVLSQEQLQAMAGRMEALTERAMQQLETQGDEPLKIGDDNLSLLLALTNVQQGILKQHATVATQLVKSAPQQVAPSGPVNPGPAFGQMLAPAVGANVQVNVNNK